jgi:hypothetical protein
VNGAGGGVNGGRVNGGGVNGQRGALSVQPLDVAWSSLPPPNAVERGDERNIFLAPNVF